VEVDSYFGCWLDVNQPQQKFLPIAPPSGNFDGPWTSQWTANQVYSITEAIIAAPHQCVIAEINYKDAPVVPNATSASSDKLAQRNIAWIDGPNPGVVASRRMTHPVQVRPTPRGTLNPDELMIFWGATPPASTAQLYLPALSAAEIAGLANLLHPAQLTSVVDEHTIGFDAEGVTFVPLPFGTALAAGLLTVTLPPGIRRGSQYQITVRQLTDAALKISPYAQPNPTRIAADASPVAVVVEGRHIWRAVAGAFQFVINIKTKEAILLNEERLLATLRWMLLNMPTGKRWYPVMQRYIDVVAGRVQGFGGNPGQILPSPVGWVPGLPQPSKPSKPCDEDKGCEEYTGKIDGLIYDHFGDFEGFVMETESGVFHRICSRERAVRELALQAKIDRCRVKVIVARHHWILRELVIL
jgi:hypothetical protein